MKLILCLLPLLCLVLYFNSVEAGVSIPDFERVREVRSTDEDPDITDDDDEKDSEKDEGEPASEDGEDDGGDFVQEPQGTKVLLKLNEKATNLFSNKSDAEINAIQKKLAELKYGAGHNR
ncbi:uncharacterized protein LOC123295522 [Chrysoperla carnea]|uniref:uncharacterized protein LOC123295522 n=1 Tax=Chrysoperla carnea TaxID=189513 RepID=UPI001D069B77|nr:uncharacterized protein LOC123295522 [Chrysoperla carnea]